MITLHKTEFLNIGKKDIQICFQYQALAWVIPFCSRILEYSSSMSPRREKFSGVFLSRRTIHSAIRGGLYAFLVIILKPNPEVSVRPSRSCSGDYRLTSEPECLLEKVHKISFFFPLFRL